MKLSINRDALLEPLQKVLGAIEKRQTMPALAHVLMECSTDGLVLTATDLEITLVARLAHPVVEPGAIAFPARKLFDICKALPGDVQIEITTKDNKANLKAGRSRFSLSCLPAAEFPKLENVSRGQQFELPQSVFKKLFERTAFAMANQDVRYYLNGLMLEVGKDQIQSVATDGHRLSLYSAAVVTDSDSKLQAIVPRKGVMELQRLLADDENSIAQVQLSANHIRIETDSLQFTSKLIDGKFPDYERVLPSGSDKELVANRDELRQALTRASILSNEKYRGIRLFLDKNILKIQAHNSEQEEAEDELEVSYDYDPIEIGFNVQYLLDVLSVIEGDTVEIKLKDGNSSILLNDPEDPQARYVIMPMRL